MLNRDRMRVMVRAWFPTHSDRFIETVLDDIQSCVDAEPAHR